METLTDKQIKIDKLRAERNSLLAEIKKLKAELLELKDVCKFFVKFARAEIAKKKRRVAV